MTRLIIAALLLALSACASNKPDETKRTTTEFTSDAALTACTHRARIPMRNNVDSLNVGIAAAIAMYELRQ